MNKRNLAICVVSGAFCASAWGGPLGTGFSYQGELRDAGAPADGDFDFIFRLFDADAGGSQVGADVPVDDWPVIGGLFTVELDFGAAAFAGDARWLEIAVRPGDSGDPHTVLSPRQPLTAAPYALFALNGPGASGFWAGSGADINNTNSGNVGIGTSSPMAKLHVAGGDVLTHDVLATGSLRSDAPTSDAEVFLGWASDSNGVDMARIRIAGNDGGATNGLAIQRPGDVSLMRILHDGSVGLGTTEPGAKLHVVGDVLSTGSLRSLSPPADSEVFLGWGSDGNGTDMARIRVGGDGDGAYNGLDIQRVGNVSLMRITDDGRVGIGDTTPDAQVDVERTFQGTEITALLATIQHGVIGSWDPDGAESTYGALGTSVAGVQGSGNGGKLAAQFVGEVSIVGDLDVSGSKNFRIDHPFDPANKYLVHACAEGPEALNLYGGNVTLDAGGQAWITLPDYFEAVNRDFRYTLTAIGAPAPNLHVARKIHGNRFLVAGGVAGQEVSWEVKGVRNDASARSRSAPVEPEKPAALRGKYLHPEAFGKPRELGIGWGKKPVSDTNE